MRSKGGFTLIELVMVIVILGILAAVAIPVFVDFQSDAKRAACRGALGGLRSGISIWYARNAALGNAAWPTITEMQNGVPMAGSRIPPNPYAGDGTWTNITEGNAPDPNAAAAWVYDDDTGDIWATGDEATAF